MVGGWVPDLLLVGADDGKQGAILFALAETYDPNMLAAWGARDKAADAVKARALYRKAFGLGVAGRSMASSSETVTNLKPFASS